MNPKCGVCNKTVYPVEKISPGNGKNYHKLCFKCSVCKITLNLKNFKSHEGTLYCPVHYAPAQVEVRSFESERKADQGEYASNPSSTQAAAGGAWGQSTPDSGEYGGGNSAAAGGYDQGGYDQGGYEQQGGYDQGGYQQEYYE
ncbi:LIM domain containing protein [Acanthamoeba castellanii str. Neff]|uniref:LIM domain containing protein n=1 Tax=Acanthamoeba castellanii (strain ATCC 30010 / Neff) TaxID=1257118 RepID=L8H5V6_ACACF|nr:LIM domain containing protein [Acanthamoeba castellanii str. Neff]ELR20098.1 LIM domain containing protein [Acanthamoeba castellanii str. Neff]